MAGYKCGVCDYIYKDADNEGLPFDKQTEVFSCPECGAWKEEFLAT